jgi:hypothetical protein
MAEGALRDLIVELFTAIRLLTGYPVPDELPQIHRAPAHVLSQKICGRPCPVKAFYHPEMGVYIDETLRIEDNAYERSILLHELVHYVQHTTGKFSAVSGFCNRKSAEEMEAYKIQNMYLSRQRTGRRALYTGAIPCVEPAAMPAAAPL